MRNVFNDSSLESTFQKDGYVIVDLIPIDIVERLKKSFFDLQATSGGQINANETGLETLEITYDFTFIDRNPKHKQLVYDHLTAILYPYVNRILKGYRVLIANYIRKTVGKGEVPVHQNWAFADERKCSTVSVWCPLVDATIENGTLQVVPGSHKRFGETRGPMIPWELEGIKDSIINKHLKPMVIPAGKAVILDDSIVHYSATNKADGLRLAIQLICIPEEMPSWHYHMNPGAGEGKVQVLEVDKEFYMNFNPWKFPSDQEPVKTVGFDFNPISEEEFAARIYGRRFDEPQPAKVARETEPEPAAAVMADDKTFWETYTPGNILREIKYRLIGG